MDAHEALVNIIEQPTWKGMLVDVIKKHKLDSWDIDVTRLTKAYLEKIKSMQIDDFRVPANAVLTASILIRYKSDQWELYPQDKFEEMVEEATGWDYVIEGQHVPELVQQRRITNRRITLEELVNAVEDVIEKEKKRAFKRSDFSVPQELVAIALEETEDYEEVLDDIYAKILANKDENDLVLFSALHDGTRKNLVNTLLPILHLAQQEKLAVWQENHFKEIFIAVRENGEAPKTSEVNENGERPKTNG